MAFDPELAARVRRLLARRKGVEEKRMFGGIGFMLKGHMLVAVSRGSLLLRLGAERAEAAMREEHVTAFTIRGRASKAWVWLDSAGIESDEKLKDWLRQATAFVATLGPPKG